MLYVGIDPDSKGALAILNLAASEMEVVHLPNEIVIKSTGTKRSFLARDRLAKLACSLVSLAPMQIAIEEQQAFEGDGIHGLFTHATNYGRLQGSLETAKYIKGGEIDISTVRAIDWKGAFGLIFPELKYSEKKKKAVAFATRLFPHHAHLWAKVMDTSLAEAALIALHTALEDGAKLPDNGDKPPTHLIQLPKNPIFA